MRYNSEFKAEGIQNFLDDLKFFQKETTKDRLKIERIIQHRKNKKRGVHFK